MADTYVPQSSLLDARCGADSERQLARGVVADHRLAAGIDIDAYVLTPLGGDPRQIDALADVRTRLLRETVPV